MVTRSAVRTACSFHRVTGRTRTSGGEGNDHEKAPAPRRAPRSGRRDPARCRECRHAESDLAQPARGLQLHRGPRPLAHDAVRAMSCNYIDQGDKDWRTAVLIGGAGTGAQAFELTQFARDLRLALHIRLICVERNGFGMTQFEPADADGHMIPFDAGDAALALADPVKTSEMYAHERPRRSSTTWASTSSASSPSRAAGRSRVNWRVRPAPACAPSTSPSPSTSPVRHSSTRTRPTSTSCAATSSTRCGGGT